MPEPGDESLDETFERIRRGAPPDVREMARALPYRLGITHRPHGGWGDFAKIEPICDLPFFALDGLGAPLSRSTIDAYRLAHRIGGFHGLCVDRVTDGQAVPDRALRKTRAWLRRERVQALGRAIGDAASAERLVARTERVFRAGTRIERAARRRGRLDAVEYAILVAKKTAWLALPTIELLRRHGGPVIAATFAHGYRLFMLTLQLFDDALDASEDENLFGVGVPALLGVSPDVVRHAARIVTARAGVELSAAGFARLAGWSAARSVELAAGASLLSALGAMALTERLAPTFVRASPPPVPWIPGGASEALCTT